MGAVHGPGLVPVDLGPGVVAGFTTRAGGVSPAPWDSLDLGLNVGDDPDRVRTNRRRVAGALGVPLAFATQVHGAHVAEVGWPGPGGTPQGPAVDADSVGEADGLVAGAGVGLGVLVADCVPVLLADADAGLVGTAHAGRRGVQLGVVGVVVDALVERGASRARVRAAVGPSVCGRCYEVPEQMRDEVAAVVPQAWSTTSAGTSGLDLRAGVLAQLAAAGVGAVTAVDVCTMEDDRFFSHRRFAGATGRFAGVVAHVGTRRAR